MKPVVSVIVPVFNGEKYLVKCLDSLTCQTLSVDEYEIIIVDNNSTDQSTDIASSYPVKVVKELKKGSYAARNKGVKIAKGEIIGFTDVDCVVDKKWLEHAVKHFKNHASVDIVAGRVDFYSDQPLNIWGIFDQNTFLNQEYAVRDGMAKTANMFVKSSLFEKVGLFDCSLQSGGDVRWTAEAVKKGAVLHYNPEIIVIHPVRNSLTELSAKILRVGYGKGQILRKGKEGMDNSTIGIKHITHPLKLLIKSSSKGSLCKNILFMLGMLSAITLVSVLFISGMIKGFVSN